MDGGRIRGQNTRPEKIIQSVNENFKIQTGSYKSY